MNLGDTFEPRKYIKATTISGHFAIQPLDIIVKKTFNAAPTFVGSTIKELRELDVTISQKDILEGKSNDLIFMLPEMSDLEKDIISVSVNAQQGETWVSIVDTELGKAFKIDPLQVKKQDNGEHHFEIWLGDNQTREKSIYDVQINIKYISYALVSIDGQEIITVEEEVVENVRGDPDFSKPRPTVRIRHFDVTHKLQFNFDQDMAVNKRMNYSRVLTFKTVSGNDLSETIGNYVPFIQDENKTRAL